MYLCSRVAGCLLPGARDQGGAEAARLHLQEVHGHALPQQVEHHALPQHRAAKNALGSPVLCFVFCVTFCSGSTPV